MGQTTSAPITVACSADGPKVQLPDNLCAQFLAEVARAYPTDRVVIAPKAGEATLTLVVERAAASVFAARLVWQGSGAGVGNPGLASAMKGGPLSAAQISSLLASLLEQNPRP